MITIVEKLYHIHNPKEIPHFIEDVFEIKNEVEEEASERTYKIKKGQTRKLDLEWLPDMGMVHISNKGDVPFNVILEETLVSVVPPTGSIRFFPPNNEVYILAVTEDVKAIVTIYPK